MAFYKEDKFYLTGSFRSDSISFGSNIVTNTSPSDASIFISKLSDNITHINSKLNNIDLTIFPNPSNGILNYRIINTDYRQIRIDIVNINNKIIFTEIHENNTNGLIDLTGYSKGVYFIKMTTNSFIKVEKIIIY